MTKPMSGPCTYCGAIVLWARHKETGRTNPLDARPHVNGNALLDRQEMRYEFLTKEDLQRARDQNVPLYIAHAAMCANPPQRHCGASRRRRLAARR